MSQRSNKSLPESEQKIIADAYKRIGCETKREKRDMQSLITVCAVIGLIGYAFFCLAHVNVEHPDPLGFVIGAGFLAILAFMIAAD